MLVASRFNIRIAVLFLCLTTLGCSGAKDTTPESEIPNIPPATRTAPGDNGSAGDGSDNFLPAPPSR